MLEDNVKLFSKVIVPIDTLMSTISYDWYCQVKKFLPSEWIYHCGTDLHFLVTNDTEHLFNMLIGNIHFCF